MSFLYIAVHSHSEGRTTYPVLSLSSTAPTVHEFIEWGKQHLDNLDVDPENDEFLEIFVEGRLDGIPWYPERPATAVASPLITKVSEQNEFKVDDQVAAEGFWIQVGPVSVYIRRTDDGTTVDLYPLGHEDEEAKASTWLADSDLSE